MTQILVDDDVRFDCGIPLGPLWIGTLWADNERREENENERDETETLPLEETEYIH